MYIVIIYSEGEDIYSSKLFQNKSDADNCMLDIAFKYLREREECFKDEYTNNVFEMLISAYSAEDIQTAYETLLEYTKEVLKKPYGLYDVSTSTKYNVNFSWTYDSYNDQFEIRLQTVFSNYKQIMTIIDTNTHNLVSNKDLLNMTPFRDDFKVRINKWFVKKSNFI
jgi:hypothetical protein